MTKLIHVLNAFLYLMNAVLWYFYAHSPGMALAWAAVAIISIVWSRRLDTYVWGG